MANQTVSVNRNFDDAAISGLANGEDITINTGARLTINSDVRWAQQAAVIGNITIDATTGGECLIDGTTVWWIPFDGGTSTVPAIGDTITGATSGATGECIGVFTGYGVAPSAGGGAMPATGFIKLRSKTGTYQDNENLQVSGVTKCVVNSTTGGKRGWLHIVGEEASTITVPRVGSLNITGDWFELDDTVSGVRNQTIQLPVADQYPGVWIETGSGTGVYEFWPNVGAQMTTTNFPSTTTDDRSKVVFISATGVLRIGSTTTPADAAYLPSTGAKIRIPNIIISSSTSANFNANTVSATLATRWDLTTTSAGAIDIDKVSGAGFNINANQAYSLSITNSAFLEQLAFSEIPTSVTLDNCHVGLPATNIAAVGSPLVVSTCFAGGTLTDCVFVRPTMAAASGIIASFTDMDGFTFDNVHVRAASPKSANTPIAYSLTRVANSTFTDCICGDGRFLITTCQNLTFTNTKYYDRTGTTTTTAQPVSAFDLTTGCVNIVMDGFASYDSLANVHPYTSIVNVSSNCQNIKLRNIGTAASPYNMGSANACGVILQANGLNSTIKVQRVYTDNARTSAFGTMVNSDTIITAESVWVDGADTQALTANNMICKGCRWTNSTTGQTAVNGTHFSDIFTSTTAGRLVLQMNEKTALEPSASAYSVIAGTPKFTATGNLAMATANDEIVYTWPYYIQGITSFAPATITQPTFTGTNPNNHDIYYKIDKNDGNGYNASWRNLAYKRSGAGGSAGTAIVTMTSTTGVNANDYVFGTGIGTNARVLTVDSPTQITVSVNNSGAVSGVLVFNQLPFETSISPTDGVKLQIRIVANTTSSTNALTYLRIDTVTTSGDQQAVSYPLDPVDVTYSFSGLAVGTEVVLFNSSNAELKREVIAGTTFEYDYVHSGTDTTGCYALIWKDDKFPIKFTGITLGNTSVDVPISQSDDLVYDAAATDNVSINFGSKLIIMDPAATQYDVQGVYSIWKDTILTSSNAQYDFAFSIVGGNVISGAKSIPYYTFLANGWKVRPDEADHTLSVVTGVLVGESGGDPFVDTLGAYTVRILFEQPVQAIAVSTGGGGGATAADVWSYGTRQLTGIGSSGIASETNATTNRTTIQSDIAALNDLSSADVTAALNTYDAPTKAELDAAQASIEADIAALPTVGQIADGVLDEAVSGHQTAGTVGRVLKDGADSAELASIK